jgi:hypothetical protein
VEAACAAGFVELSIKMLRELSEVRGKEEDSDGSKRKEGSEDLVAVKAHFDDIGDQIFSVLSSLCKHPATIKGILESKALDLMLEMLLVPERSSPSLRSGAMTVITVLRSSHPAEVVEFMHDEGHVERLLRLFADSADDVLLPLACDVISVLR